MLKLSAWLAMATLAVFAAAAPALASDRQARQAWNEGARTYQAGDMAATRQHFSRACTLGHDRACFNVGVMHRDGVGGDADAEHARWLFGRACELGNAGGCFNQGHMAMHAQGGAADDARARIAFEAACAGGIAGGCNGLGILLEQGRGGAPEPVRARALYQQACSGGGAESCINLATVLANGIGGSTDAARARQVLTSSCDGGAAGACTALTALNAGTLGQPEVVAGIETLRAGIEAYNAERYADALRLLRPNAEAGDASAQYILGFIYTYGLSVSRDYLAAADWLTRSAEQDYEYAQDLIVRIAPNIAQARYVDHIDRFGPDRSSLQAFSYDVAVYCTFRGAQCSALRNQERSWRTSHNAAAEAENMRRIWNNYGQGQTMEQFYTQSRARSECLRRVAESIEAQSRGRQQWRFVNNC
ncbi:MAG: hypothetical protein LAT81_00350 [Oceanicaulis sp.]|nr:hypothetical protein [Oceanicaulis sp.]